MGLVRAMHWTHRSRRPSLGCEVREMNDVLPREVLRHGAYVCLGARDRRALHAVDLPALARRLGLHDEFVARDGHPGEAIAYLRRAGATAADIGDEGLLGADAIVHVASASAEP